MKVLTPGRKPIYSWCKGMDDKAFEQFVNLSNHPKLFHHVVASADAHGGFGAPIGSVFGLDNAIMPGGIGMDCGCGVVARKLSMFSNDISKGQRIALRDRISNLVPVGLGIVRDIDKIHPFGAELMDATKDELRHYNILQGSEVEYIARSMGTLGAGNHSLEVHSDESGNVWIMIHTGSRKLGSLVNNRFHKNGAMKLCDMWESNIADPDIAFLPIGTSETSMYISAMSIAMAFAKLNRSAILQDCMQAFSDVLGYKPEFDEEDNSQPEINAHHNYAAVERHYGKNVWVHRKGAIKVADGELGIILGDMSSNSHIVVGKGCRESFNSCSHGAGRAMSRTAANMMISTEEAEASMEGIIHGPFTKTNLRTGLVTKDTSEAHGSYKDIGEVMEQQKGLFDIMHTLSPIINIKG